MDRYGARCGRIGTNIPIRNPNRTESGHGAIAPFLATARKNLDNGGVSTVLLVEDNELNRDMLSRRLERRGFRIVVATDGLEGIALAQSERPDLILMDMSLPRVDGWEATRRLKADQATRSIPIIALTAHAMAADCERALDAGCDAFDTKPIDLPRLLDKIRALLPSER